MAIEIVEVVTNDEKSLIQRITSSLHFVVALHYSVFLHLTLVVALVKPKDYVMRSI